MISLVFMICLEGGLCETISPTNVYSTAEACEADAKKIIVESQSLVALGQLPPHTVVYACIAWGEPA